MIKLESKFNGTVAPIYEINEQAVQYGYFNFADVQVDGINNVAIKHIDDDYNAFQFFEVENLDWRTAFTLYLSDYDIDEDFCADHGVDFLKTFKALANY